METKIPIYAILPVETGLVMYNIFTTNIPHQVTKRPIHFLSLRQRHQSLNDQGPPPSPLDDVSQRARSNHLDMTCHLESCATIFPPLPSSENGLVPEAFYWIPCFNRHGNQPTLLQPTIPQQSRYIFYWTQVGVSVNFQRK